MEEYDDRRKGPEKFLTGKMCSAYRKACEFVFLGSASFAQFYSCDKGSSVKQCRSMILMIDNIGKAPIPDSYVVPKRFSATFSGI